jgi:hypothetical protein
MIFSAFTGSLTLCSGFGAIASKISSSTIATGTRDRRSLPWAHLFSRFRSDLSKAISSSAPAIGAATSACAVRRGLPVKVVDPHLVVVADARRQRAAKFRIKGAGHCG